MSDPFLGQIILFAGNFAPRGWALCDGQLLPINQNQALFSLLGTIYGGDGRTTLALPDLRGRVPIGMGQGAGLTNRNQGSRSGAEAVVLNQSQMPSHSHGPNDTSGLTAELQAHGVSMMGNQPAPGPANVLARFPNVNLYSNSEANLTPIAGPQATMTVASAGADQSHNNLQPYLGINYIIALQGIFPSRN